jgi:hypothetical protein
MPGERKGKVYESIIYSVLAELVAANCVRGKLYWNETPMSMSIEPDFTIGVDPNTLYHGLLVTHCNSPRNSDMKGWRNLGELTELKTALPMVPQVAAITFGLIKEDLAPIQHAAFDSFRWVTHRPPERYAAPQPWLVLEGWAGELDKFTDEIEDEMPPQTQRPAWILETIGALSGKLRNRIGYDELRALLVRMFAERNRSSQHCARARRSRSDAPTYAVGQLPVERINRESFWVYIRHRDVNFGIRV